MAWLMRLCSWSDQSLIADIVKDHLLDRYHPIAWAARIRESKGPDMLRVHHVDGSMQSS